MEIEDSGDLIYQTYYMVNWGVVKQTPSDATCVSCGEKMMNVEPLRDKKGLIFEGTVCHKCKTVLWVRKE